MSGEEAWKQQIPPGFRFIPTDEEILQYYLFRYVTGNYILPGIIPLVDLYECDPDYLPGVNMEGEYTYFFTRRDRKYVNGTKNTSRVTRDGRGYWKSTNKKAIVVAQDGSKLGKKTTLKYYFKNPEGDDIPAQWIMHEYVISCKIVKPSIEDEYYEDIAACRIYKKKPEIKEKTLIDPNIDHNNEEPQLSVKRKFIASDPPHDTTMTSNYLCDSQAALMLDGMRTTYEIGQTSNTKSIPIEISHTSSTNLTPFEIDQMSYTKSTLFEIGQTSNTNSTPLEIDNIVPMGEGVFVGPTDQTSTNVYQNQSNEGKIEGTNFDLDLDLDELHNVLHDSSPPDESFEEYWQSLQI
ncbi:NAC domain-containing protein 2-like [Solanum pennellii]|uniref:NAC domain-containing protein 2-like n=1 Tax=Solanum pennellii TaxID=28526 RepID=A0ABM1VC48_SOLPN|nr:NAC domain-containing protein 2-like [Solanum pennellii]